MISDNAVERLPRPLRRLANLIRRLPFVFVVMGTRPLEPAVKRLYSQHIASDDVVIEVGARIGDATRTLASIARHVYSFEPSRPSFLVLKTLTRTHNNVDVYNTALSDRPGDAYLYRDRHFSGVASLKRLNDVNYASQERVSVSTLDQIVFKVPPTSLVLDCEGSELDVLEGGAKLLPHLRLVLVETHTLSNGTSTLGPVEKQLSRLFQKVKVDRVGNENWVVASS